MKQWVGRFALPFGAVCGQGVRKRRARKHSGDKACRVFTSGFSDNFTPELDKKKPRRSGAGYQAMENRLVWVCFRNWPYRPA